MLNIQKEIREFGLQSVIDKYSLVCKHGRHKILLKYHQIDSYPHRNVMAVRECRGLILERDTWNVMPLPFIRFFNYGEEGADQICWESSRILRKEDGSLMALYFDWVLNEWCVQTSGTLEGDSEVHHHDITFKKLFWKTFNVISSTSFLDKNLNYVFELKSPLNTVVERHEEKSIVLLTVRDRPSLKELQFREVEKIASVINIPVVKTFDFKTFDDVLNFIQSLKTDQFEGFVVLDEKTNNRIKIKSPKYIITHRLKDKLKLYELLTVVLSNEQDEFLLSLPEYKENITLLEKNLATTIQVLNSIFVILLIIFKVKTLEDFKKIEKKSLKFMLNAIFASPELSKFKIFQNMFFMVYNDNGFNPRKDIERISRKQMYNFLTNL